MIEIIALAPTVDMLLLGIPESYVKPPGPPSRVLVVDVAVPNIVMPPLPLVTGQLDFSEPDDSALDAAVL
jgi:hypothetical protein